MKHLLLVVVFVAFVVVVIPINAYALVNIEGVGILSWESSNPSSLSPYFIRLAFKNPEIGKIAGRTVKCKVTMDGKDSKGMDCALSQFQMSWEVGSDSNFVEEISIGQFHFGRELERFFLDQDRPVNVGMKSPFTHRGIMATGNLWQFGWDVGACGGNSCQADNNKNFDWFGRIKYEPIKTLVFSASAWGGPQPNSHRRAGIFGFEYDGRLFRLRSETSWFREGKEDWTGDNYALALYKGFGWLEPVVCWEDDVVGAEHARSFSAGINFLGESMKLQIDCLFGKGFSPLFRTAVVCSF
ncbi:hypothetical protein KKD19_06500 [Patescibacteria group bacterium]|nr:hypothetical protein [Patescibacteria group bacterium]MBU4512852.1 hypothetical protein [Patescibacteria group bacterium]MCG2693627.1 hypothetical protein [Candidatus Parcubacteria bacterium]